MAKWSMPLRVVETPPQGSITDADPPRPVTIRVRWSIDTEHVVIDRAWALAWTDTEVLIFWRTDNLATTAWLRADQVVRR